MPSAISSRIPKRIWKLRYLAGAASEAEVAKQEVDPAQAPSRASQSVPHPLDRGRSVQPLQLPPGSRIKVDLKQVQEIDSQAGAHSARRLVGERRSELDVVGAGSAARAQNIERLQQLDKQLAQDSQCSASGDGGGAAATSEAATLEFERGNFLTKIGPDLAPDVPGDFPEASRRRSAQSPDAGKMVLSPGQPLTARMAVNRYWEELFGTGIVETLENFGSVGEEPSHPELLDWLALHFQNDLHWDMKALLRELVTSATYRQSATTTPALTAKDPRNRLLAHGPQQRLTAEMVRDQALMASGLLSTTMGGPPVMPPQPAGVWNYGLQRQQVDGCHRPESLSPGGLYLYQAHQRLSQLSRPSMPRTTIRAWRGAFRPTRRCRRWSR